MLKEPQIPKSPPQEQTWFINEEGSLSGSLGEILREKLGLAKEKLCQLEAAPEEVKFKCKKIVQETLNKISERLGSNEGGWYEDSSTGTKYYVKLYSNPLQARVEWLANEIYHQLGINSVRSQLFEMGEKLAIASPELEGGQSATREEIKSSLDVLGGFIADAFLANWDSMGLVYDNILKKGDGFYRIDNGGVLVFRAQGGPKEFSPDVIPELENMRNPIYPSGTVFGEIGEEEMKRQAEELLEKVTDKFIENILVQSGILNKDPEIAGKIKQGLLGRRRVLAQRFGLELPEERLAPQKRIPRALRRLADKDIQLPNLEINPRVSILADTDCIENQQVDIIEDKDSGKIFISFKLTKTIWKEVLERLFGSDVEEFSYNKTKKQANGEIAETSLVEMGLCYRLDLDKENIILRVAKGINDYGVPIHSAHGLVQIEISKEAQTEEIGEIVNRAIVQHLGVESGLVPPTEEAEKQYKLARYAWHHMLEKGDVPEGALGVLTREEVFPDYFTMVERGRSKEYSKSQPFAVFHETENFRLLPTIIKAGGLFSTHERFRRGLCVSGMSSDDDIKSGGADSVFTRIIKKENNWGKNEIDGCFYIIFKSSLLDRTDWYAYNEDVYGISNGPTFYEKRISPTDIFNRGLYLRSSNEQMFRTGIGVNDFAAIACPPRNKAYLVQLLKDGGIHQINGVKIEDFIIEANTKEDFISIAEGRYNPQTAISRLKAEELFERTGQEIEKESDEEKEDEILKKWEDWEDVYYEITN